MRLAVRFHSLYKSCKSLGQDFPLLAIEKGKQNCEGRLRGGEETEARGNRISIFKIYIFYLNKYLQIHPIVNLLFFF